MAGRFLNNPPLLRQMPTDGKNSRPWMLMEDLRYQSGLLNGEVIIVPAGFRTDFASCPWVCRRFFPQDGPWTHAAITHDYLCDLRPVYASSKQAAAIFLEAMEALKVPVFQRNAMYQAVRWFGPRWP